MPRMLVGGLIQCSQPDQRRVGARSPKIQKAMFDKHLPFIEEAGKKGVQILCLQEIFNGPYFCPAQDPRWYDAAEAVPGPDHRGRWPRSRRSTRWRSSCRSTSASRPASTTTPPPCSTPTARTSASTARTTSRRPSGFWEKYFFKPGNLGYPVFQTRYAKVGVYICYDRHFPEGARLLGLNGAEIVFNPSATVAGLSQYLWKLEQPAHAVANGYFIGGINRVGTEAPVEHRQVLRLVLLRRPARQLPRAGAARTRTSWSSPRWTST